MRPKSNKFFKYAEQRRKNVCIIRSLQEIAEACERKRSSITHYQNITFRRQCTVFVVRFQVYLRTWFIVEPKTKSTCHSSFSLISFLFRVEYVLRSRKISAIRHWTDYPFPVVHTEKFWISAHTAKSRGRQLLLWRRCNAFQQDKLRLFINYNQHYSCTLIYRVHVISPINLLVFLGSILAFIMYRSWVGNA